MGGGGTRYEYVPYADNPAHAAGGTGAEPHAHIKVMAGQAYPGGGGGGAGAGMGMGGVGLYDPAPGMDAVGGRSHDALLPGSYPYSDPTMMAFSAPGASGVPDAYLQQELCAIPYRPMEPRLRRWAKSEIAPEDVVLPLLLITFQTGWVWLRIAWMHCRDESMAVGACA
jgi:hypothetical protein